MKKIVPFLLLLIAVIGIRVRGQQAPDQTLAALKPAPGLAVGLWASEPMITNPTDMTIDERGRVWVLEGANYRRVSRKLPDIRPEGDRIVILEDTNNDGKADNAKVFDQSKDLRVPLGIAVLGDKVYVSQSPDIIVYTKDAADKIVKKEVLLTGFGGTDHDHGLHAVVFGPDGKYYFNQGNTGFDVLDKSGTRQFMQPQAGGGGGGNNPITPPAGAGPPTGPGFYQGVVLRVNPDGTNLQVLGQNFRNPYEVAVDSWGNVFQTDNDDDGNAQTRLVYNMEGGNYGFRGPMNRTWTDDKGTHWHQELPGVVPNVYRIGAGSPCGLLVYEGNLLPARYRGKIFHADAGKRRIAMYPLDVAGAGFVGGAEDFLNGGDDTWARPSDVAVAPDGSVYVADWYDPGVGGHNMGDLEGNRGRIYRVAPVGNKPMVPKLDLASNAGLTAAFGSGNQSAFFLAHQAIKNQGQAAAALLQGLWRQSDPIVKARALWLLGALGQPGQAAIQEASRNSDPRFRILALRVAQATGANMVTFSKPLLRDASPQVRREVALVIRDTNPSLMLPPYAYPAQTQPSTEVLDALVTLASQYDGRDRWYLEALNISARGREDALYARLKTENAGKWTPQYGQLLWGLRPRTALSDLVATINDSSASNAQRMASLDAVGNMQWPEAARAVESFILAPSTSAQLAEHAFGHYSHQLFSMWMDARKLPQFASVVRKAFTLPGAQAAAVTLADPTIDPMFVPDLLTLAKLGTATPDVRAAALEAVAGTRDLKFLPDLQALQTSGPTPVRVAAIRAVSYLNQPSTVSWAQQIVLSDSPNEVRTEALRMLGGSVDGLNAILDMAEKQTLPAELTGLARNLTNYSQPPAPPGRGGRGGPQSPVTMRSPRGAMPTDPAYVAIRQRAMKILPLPAAARIPTAFELDLNYNGRTAEGRKIFDSDGGCAACHSLGGARKMGPDLSNIGGKFGKQAMLDNILNPSDAISVEYVTQTITLKSGEQVTGIVSGDTAENVTLTVGADSTRRLRTADIASRTPVRISPMPEGLLGALTHQQVADLLEYLATLK